VKSLIPAGRAAALAAAFNTPIAAVLFSLEEILGDISHLEILNSVVALDPTIRQLTSEEKYRRSILILDRARMELAACAPNSSLLSTADSTVRDPPPAHVTNEDAEKVLASSESIWRARNDACATSAKSDQVLTLLMKKLAS
jgi:hypothetical protein